MSEQSLTPTRLAQLRWAAAACALAGLGALVAHVAGLMEMPYFLSFIGVPSLLLLFMMAVFARRVHAGVFLTALGAGLVGGLLATFVYDGVRLALNLSGILDYDGFRAITIFGSWMTGTEPSTTPAIVLGWLYHFWNGISFGIFYALIVGRGTWYIGLAYGLVMELMMLGLFPFFLPITDRVDFIVLSLVGHAFYGLTLGWFVQTYGRSWKTA
jgi:hypothetical protein